MQLNSMSTINRR